MASDSNVGNKNKNNNNNRGTSGDSNNANDNNNDNEFFGFLGERALARAGQSVAKVETGS